MVKPWLSLAIALPFSHSAAGCNQIMSGLIWRTEGKM
jgi:hypothetical protein